MSRMKKGGWLSVLGMLCGSLTVCAAAFPLERWARDPVELGAWLLGELRCGACHPVSPGTAGRLSTPARVDLRSRLALRPPGFVEALLESPAKALPGGRMPDLLAGLPEPERRERVGELAAFLGTLASPAVPAAARFRPHPLRFQQGRVLYRQVGCVACHPPFEPPPAQMSPEAGGYEGEVEETPVGAASVTGELPTADGLPLTGLAGRWTVASLTRWLVARPEAFPGRRMPSLNLTPAEAAAVAEYLLGRERAASPPSSPETRAEASAAALMTAGRLAFAELGCAACHAVMVAGKDLASRRWAPPLGDLDVSVRRGCLAATPGPGTPRFDLTDAQTAALRAALSAWREGRPAPADPRTLVRRELAANRCFACHERAGTGGVTPGLRPWFQSLSAVELGEEGRLPPHLNRTGAKLRPGWLEQVLREGTRVRPYLATHMPAWPPATARRLAGLLGAADRAGKWQPIPPPPAGDAAAGRRLLGPEGAGCVTCHALAGEPGLTLNVMDLAWTSRRLEWTWFSRYLPDPTSLRPGTRMPSFWPDGRSAVPDILDGDAEAQIRALWTCLGRLSPP